MQQENLYCIQEQAYAYMKIPTKAASKTPFPRLLFIFVDSIDFVPEFSRIQF